jgi:hypothetical protein
MPKNYLPDLRFLPEGLTKVTAATPLANGVTLGSFLIGTTLQHIPELSDRIQLARNLLPHAEILSAIKANQRTFADHTLVVVEGVYKQSPEEQMTENDSNHNFLAKTGRGVVYELRINGKVDNDKTFELARYLQIYHRTYDKIILDYDVQEEGILNAQIIIQTPNIPSTYDVRFKGIVETQFNNTTQATGQLVEVTERPNTKVTFPANLPDNVAGYFTVGDIHARLLRVYGGDPWQSYGQDARTSRDVAIKQNINRIRAGQVVVISAGYNDAVTTTDTPEAIGKRVADIVNTSVRLGHVVTFMLYRITQKGETARQEAIRASIVSELSSFANVRIVDLNAAQYSFGVGGIALSRESYISISDSLI